MNNTATITGIKNERAPLAVRRFIAHIRRYTMSPNGKDADRVMLLANKVADRYFTTSRAFHYAELTMDGHGRHAIKYIVQEMERSGYTLEGVTTDCTPPPKKQDPNACGKCGGEGYLPHYSYIENGTCFSCGGTGKK